jgi:hypothetical protein
MQGPKQKRSRSGSGDVFLTGGFLAAENDAWDPGVDVADDVANHPRLARRAFDAVRVPGAMVTAAWRGCARAIGGFPASARGRVPLVSSARTKRERRRQEEVDGDAPAAGICGERFGHHGEEKNPEAKKGEKVSRRCAMLPGRQWCGRR